MLILLINTYQSNESVRKFQSLQLK